jgi:hypothetical protein
MIDTEGVEPNLNKRESLYSQSFDAEGKGVLGDGFSRYSTLLSG